MAFLTTIMIARMLQEAEWEVRRAIDHLPPGSVQRVGLRNARLVPEDLLESVKDNLVKCRKRGPRRKSSRDNTLQIQAESI